MLAEWDEMKKLYRGPYIDVFCLVWFHLVQLFQRSRLKYEKLTNGRRTPVSHMTLWVRWANKADTYQFLTLCTTNIYVMWQCVFWPLMSVFLLKTLTFIAKTMTTMFSNWNTFLRAVHVCVLVKHTCPLASQWVYQEPIYILSENTCTLCI